MPTLADRVVDTVNPLQHIPFVGHLYRSITHDAITPDAQLAGGFLFGGPIGALGAAAGMIASGLFKEMSGGEQETRQAFAQNSFAETKSRASFGAWDFNA